MLMGDIGLVGVVGGAVVAVAAAVVGGFAIIIIPVLLTSYSCQLGRRAMISEKLTSPRAGNRACRSLAGETWPILPSTCWMACTRSRL